MPQCKAEATAGRTTLYCVQEDGHDGPHVFSERGGVEVRVARDVYVGYSQAVDRAPSCLEDEIASLKDQLKSYKNKVNRVYLLAEKLDEEALVGAWDDVKNAKMRAAALIRQYLEG